MKKNFICMSFIFSIIHLFPIYTAEREEKYAELRPGSLDTIGSSPNRTVSLEVLLDEEESDE